MLTPSDMQKLKLKRLHKAAESLYDKVEQMRDAAQGPERRLMRTLLVPVRNMLEAALDQCSAEGAGPVAAGLL